MPSYAVDAANKDYEFWKRDLLAIPLFTRDMAYQKMDYIHHNPCADKWQLADEPNDYFYSSAKFYEKGVSDFSFLKDLRNDTHTNGEVVYTQSSTNDKQVIPVGRYTNGIYYLTLIKNGTTKSGHIVIGH